MTKKVNPQSIHFWNNEKILIDANIWLYVFGPEALNAPKVYSNTFYEMLEHGAKLYINFAIISEFINRSTRISYAAYLKKYGYHREDFNYKIGYRPTEDFKVQYNQAMANIKDILNISTIISTKEESIKNSVNYLSMLDFNDDIIIKDGLNYQLSIFTADKDYLEYPDENLKVYYI